MPRSHTLGPDLLACYHHSAYTRIFEPLLAGSHLPDAAPHSFAALTLSGISIPSVFSHFTTALKAWFASWLAIPVCSYFYLPQPAYALLAHDARALIRWVRVAGPSAIKPPGAGAGASSQKALLATAPWQQQQLPALNGVPPCPDLSVQPERSPVLEASQAASAQILDALRARIMARPELQVDILGVLDTMVARFEAARKEMAAAQGVEWENETWDLAAEQMRMKKARVEKWCDVVAMAAAEGRTDADDTVDEGSGELVSHVEDFEWLTPGFDLDNMQWESAMFDEIMQDMHTGGAVFSSSGDWDTGLQVDIGSGSGPSA